MITKSTFQSLPILLGGMLFFIAYWYWGYDGIVFSDDVTYIRLGHHFWKGNEVLNTDHFTLRWGTYFLPGLFTVWLGFNDHIASLSSLLFYLAALFILWKSLSNSMEQKWAIVFFVTPVYLLHFLPKVFPDSALVFWVLLVPFSIIHRNKKPLLAALIMALALFIGFCTKETMVLLFPIPIILFLLDYKKSSNRKFYEYFIGISLVLIINFLGYHYWKFGDPLFRFKSIDSGHYISDYTYYDKGWKSILQRITYLPLYTFIERQYWIWVVLAIPGIIRGYQSRNNIHFAFSLTSTCLILGFWFMTSTMAFYNPIYLNPRHLIIFIGPLSANIALGSQDWLKNAFWKNLCSLLIFIGAIIILFSDLKMAAFYGAIALVLFLVPSQFKWISFAVLLIIPSILAANYQKSLKNYPHLKEEFQKLADQSDIHQPLLTHTFLAQSQSILLENNTNIHSIHSMERAPLLLGKIPLQFNLLIYKYYKHAYPDEERALQNTLKLIQSLGYTTVVKREDKWIKILRFKNVTPNKPLFWEDQTYNKYPYIKNGVFYIKTKDFGSF
ncbi:hypothetical protein QWY93_00410 [Echinicola jeungdonensis]|uniref:Glycosyltransferase RgtA/B/C/D-like domain-containing protein n=1 Tax=Echinicola jeungdonensis TaxID=709343 RepID=A0ABV5J0L0_9BACT|nr:hypothetical protein [Echinicola jeungdonensis]MDN3667803.1 hypothetical protein [Echinicola jeungdonensis]